MKKRLLAVLLAGVMVIGSTITVFAADGSGGSDNSSAEEASTSSSDSYDDDDDDDDDSVTVGGVTVDVEDIKGAGATINVGGLLLKTTVDGVYAGREALN